MYWTRFSWNAPDLLWLFTGLSFLFTFSQIPMVLRHGMGEDAKDELIENPPVDQ